MLTILKNVCLADEASVIPPVSFLPGKRNSDVPNMELIDR